MFFSYDCAIREIKRCREAGDYHTKIKKVWYGWILIDESKEEKLCGR